MRWWNAESGGQLVEKRSKGRSIEEEQTAPQEQAKKVRIAEEEQSEETRVQRTDEKDVMGGLEEARTGRGSAGLVRGGDEGCQADETNGKGKGKGSGGKASTEEKDDLDAKEHNRKRMRGSKWRLTWRQVVPHSQAMTDLEEKEGEQERNDEGKRKKEKGTRKKWADCDDDEEEKERQEGQEAERKKRREKRGKRPKERKSQGNKR